MNRRKINLALSTSKAIDNMEIVLSQFREKLRESIELMTPEERKVFRDELWLLTGGQ